MHTHLHAKLAEISKVFAIGLRNNTISKITHHSSLDGYTKFVRESLKLSILQMVSIMHLLFVNWH